MNHRTEKDSLGEVLVPTGALWGAQTARSLQNFAIGHEKMPTALIKAYAQLKWAAAKSNQQAGKLSDKQTQAIVTACEEILADQHPQQFPLSVWQTGSGTQTNMNLNEVIANRANELLGHARGSYLEVHPNDHVNASQSSNDSFPSAMHIAIASEAHSKLLPTLDSLNQALDDKVKAFDGIIKIGRTHLQDAVPLTMGQAFSAYWQLMHEHHHDLKHTLTKVYELAIGGTAVGTGLNAPKDFAKTVTQELKTLNPLPFCPTANTFAALSAHQALAAFSGALANLAASLHKMANDIRLLASGPRCGLSELILPGNEPGSSIMPGKVNPTQCEALTMVALHVQSSHHAVLQAASHGHFELNVYKPLIAYHLLNNIQLLHDAMQSFTQNCLVGLRANEKKIKGHLDESLMLVTALNPIIGYTKAALIAKYAYDNDCTLKQAATRELNLLDEATFDSAIRPDKMI